MACLWRRGIGGGVLFCRGMVDMILQGRFWFCRVLLVGVDCRGENGFSWSCRGWRNRESEREREILRSFLLFCRLFL